MSEYYMSKTNSNPHIKRNSIKSHKEYEKNESKERKRNILYLIQNYLREQNLLETADVLRNEAQLTNQFEICDNVDMDIIYQDYESYYLTKFNKKPKVLKKIIDGELKVNEQQNIKRKSRGSINTSSNLINTQTKVQEVKSTNEQINYQTEFQIEVTSLTNTKQNEKTKSSDSTKATTILNSSDVYTKPLCDFDGYSIEWREIAEQIVKEIVPKSLGVKWSDCIGLDVPKEILKEAAVYPFIYPELFNGLIAPWRGILLYGPPGTGKTLLAKALASETETTFINLTNSSFISKWRGESEKMIKVLFDIAKYYAPTTIFIDEIDSIAYRHDDTHHDASRRFKSELLTQLDGILSSNQQILVLAATNSPWDLDTAILRRFEKRIYLDLPSESNRTELFKYFLAQAGFHFNNNDYMAMAELTELFSGSDIRLICKEICMNLFRKKLIEINKTGNHDKVISEIPETSDVLMACKKINPVINFDILKRYKVWTQQYANT